MMEKCPNEVYDTDCHNTILGTPLTDIA